MALGSYLAGIAIANAGTGAVHALAYPLGSRFGLSHGMSNSVMFAAVSEANVPADLDKFAILAHTLGSKTEGMSRRESAAAYTAEITSIIRDVGLPSSLTELGIKASDLDQLVSDAAKQTRLLINNPRALSPDDIATVYSRALLGEGCSR
jgi:alcohol dehydrogenase